MYFFYFVLWPEIVPRSGIKHLFIVEGKVELAHPGGVEYQVQLKERVRTPSSILYVKIDSIVKLCQISQDGKEI